MRTLVALAAALTLSACGKDEAPPPAAGKQGLTIKTDPATLPVSKGKLAVLPKDAAPAPPAAVQPSSPAVVAPDPDEYALPPTEQEDRWAQAPEPSPRDCRRAARFGDPLADSPVCQDMLAAEEDERLVADCMDAEAEDHPFAGSPQCLRALRRR